jgi:alpha-tubulin suppressor-like RCC1 family protein
MSDCLDGQCTHSCEGGYAACGISACCSSATDGDVKAIAVGPEFSCGLTSGGAVLCWGDGSYGALGDGMIADRSFTPVAVKTLGSGAVQLSLGKRHACVVTSTGAARCWGDDGAGQLGDGARQPQPGPVSPVGLQTGVASVAAGASHTCALTTAGGVKCWGDNSHGQLGNGGPPLGGATPPMDVIGLTSGVTQVASGDAFACAVTATGGVKCWGDGAYGQLGGPPGSATPIDVPLPFTVRAVAAGGRHACALGVDGAVQCWGAADANQLGTGKSDMPRTAAPVPGIAHVTALSAGGDETCALDASGAVWCWGPHLLGDSGMPPAGPAIVPSLAGGVGWVTAAGGHACAVMTAGAPKCWGVNDVGQLGDGTTIDSWVPVDVSDL